MSCIYGIEQSCSECRMCQDKKEEQASTETVKERKDSLISRSAVIELIESKFVDGCLEKGEETLIGGYGLLDEVFGLPVAYDVDEVVEKLLGNHEDIRANPRQSTINLEEAIRIVRVGGVNEQKRSGGR